MKRGNSSKVETDEAASLRWSWGVCANDITQWRPAMPFKIGPCANKHCVQLAREISPYCDKCEPDI